MKKLTAVILLIILLLGTYTAATANTIKTISQRALQTNTRISGASSAADPIAAAISALIRLYGKDGPAKAAPDIAKLAGTDKGNLPEALIEFIEIARAMIRNPKENRVDFGTMASLILAAADDYYSDQKSLNALGAVLQKLSDMSAG